MTNQQIDALIRLADFYKERERAYYSKPYKEDVERAINEAVAVTFDYARKELLRTIGSLDKLA